MMPLLKGATAVLALMVLISGCTGTSVNHPPSIKSWDPKGDATAPEEGSATFRVNASDPDGQRLTCRWYLDGVLNYSGAAPFVFIYSPGRATGDHTLQAVVSDGSLTAVHAWKVDVYKVNHPPSVTALLPAGREPPVNEGGTLEFRVGVQDPDGDPVALAWSLDGKPVGQVTASYLFQPGYDMAGPHAVRLAASDGQRTTEIAWNVTVVNVNRAPRITDAAPPGEPRLRELDILELRAEAVDDDGDTVSYSWSLDGVQAGNGPSYNYTPDYFSQGNHAVTVAASDGSLEVRRSWNVLVDNQNRPPEIASSGPEGDPSTSEWEPLTFTLDGADEDQDPLRVSWYIDNASVSAGTGSEFNYTPGYDSAGMHTVRGVLSDGNATVTRNWNVSVRRAAANWTVLAFMNADNDLEPYLMDDFGEMETAGSTPKVNIVVQLDRHPGYDATRGDWKGARRYRVERQPANSSLLLDLGPVNMGSEQAFRDFLLWGLEKFPAERYQIIMSGHGDGWMGISQDFSSSNDKLSLASVASSLRSFVTARGAPVDVLEFDVCYWAMLETGWGLRDLASYIVGSEEIDPSPGQTYGLYLDSLTARPGMTARGLALETVQAFYRGYTDGTFWPEDNETFTQSAVDTARLAAVSSCLDALSRLLADNPTVMLPALRSARQSVESYGKPEFIDLYDLVRLLRQYSPSDALNASADAVLEAVRQAVISEVHGQQRQGSHGLSIYFPAYSYSYKASYGELNFTRENSWGRLLLAYYNATGRGAPEGRGGCPPAEGRTPFPSARVTRPQSAASESDDGFTVKDGY